MNLDEARRLFFDEASDLLGRMEDLLLRMEQAPADEETLSALFRCAHTIKGSAGIFAFEDLVSFMHGVEAELSSVRSGLRVLDAEAITTLLACKDHAQLLLSAASSSRTVDATLQGHGDALLTRLGADPASAGTDTRAPGNGGVGPSAAFRPTSGTANAPTADDAVAPVGYELLLRPGVDVFRRGLDPLAALRQLSKFSDIVEVETELGPEALRDPNPESCHVSFRVSFRTRAPETRILGLFEFFGPDSEVTLRALESSPEAGPPEWAAEPAAAPAAEAALQRRSGFVRVGTDKLDSLINLVGELVIAGAHMHELAGHAGEGALVESSRSLSRMISDLRDQSLRVRMVPLSEAFARFHRAVRETALATGREARLDVRVGDSEMDKNLIESISEPLLHIIRNSVDHSIEAPAARRALGKSAVGTVGIQSYRETGSIVLEIWDDGRGFNVESIIQTARKRGLLASEREVPEAEALQLMFQPGFSTRDEVTSISGRGVGMDIVQKTIQGLRGSVHVENRAKGGSLTRIRLPLTLAIIEGFLVRLGRAPYVIPMELVTECIEFDAVEVRAQSDVLLLRDEVLPFLRPAELFGEPPTEATRENVVVVEYARRRAGLVVQGLLGEFQAVIKPLNRMFAGLRGISGATILGDGSVALILDIPSLIDYVVGRERMAAHGKV